MSPTNKQAKDDSGREPKLHLWQNGEKNIGRNQATANLSINLMDISVTPKTQCNEVQNSKYSKKNNNNKTIRKNASLLIKYFVPQFMHFLQFALRSS